MTADELRELADVLSIPIQYTYGPTHTQRAKISAYLRACADAMEAGPVAWRYKPMLGSPWSLSDDGYYISCKRDQGYIAEKLYPLAMPATAIPQGWRLVPVEPTNEMFRAAFDATREDQIDWMRKHYLAMLASAPSPPVAAENTSAERVAETAELEHEPVAWLTAPHGAIKANPLYRFSAPQSLDWRIPLYAHPPALRLPEPMTDAAVEEICWTELDRRLLSFARAIEAETLRRVKEANE